MRSVSPSCSFTLAVLATPVDGCAWTGAERAPVQECRSVTGAFVTRAHKPVR